jgi:hypothetical protein
MPQSEFTQVLRYAKARDREDGRAWYVIANKKIHDIADRHGLEFEKVAGIVAVLSPSVEWDANLQDANEFIRLKGRHACRTYGRNVRTARKILRAKSSFTVLGIIAGLQGFKVKAFFDNLVNPLTSTSVTIDTHLIRAWHGSPFLTKAQVGAGFRGRLYSEISRDVVALAEQMQIRPLEAQAILWVTWKKIAPFKKSAALGQGYFEALI